MNPVPEIAPEVRGLLEELVADPRSSMRLVPRRALRTWFEGGEVLRPREAGSTALERHLVAAHREALARLLYEASRIAYWKNPEFAHSPRDKSGNPFDPVAAEAWWRRRARGRASAAGADTALLLACLEGPTRDQGQALAQASVSLVPRVESRVYLALQSPWGSREAVEQLEPVLRLRMATGVRAEVLSCLASALCADNDLHRARDLYWEAARSAPAAAVHRIYCFNLSCFLGDQSRALQEARTLSSVASDDPQLAEARTILREWKATRTREEAERATSVVQNVLPDLPAAVVPLAEVLLS